MAHHLLIKGDTQWETEAAAMQKVTQVKGELIMKSLTQTLTLHLGAVNCNSQSFDPSDLFSLLPFSNAVVNAIIPYHNGLKTPTVVENH